MLRRYEMFKPYLVYIDFCLLSPHIHSGAPAFGRRDTRLSEAAPVADQMGVNVEAEEDKLL